VTTFADLDNAYRRLNSCIDDINAAVLTWASNPTDHACKAAARDAFDEADRAQSHYDTTAQSYAGHPDAHKNTRSRA